MKESIKWMNAPPMPGSAYFPTSLERWANFLSHLIFIPVSLFAMLDLHSRSDTSAESLAVLVYGSTCVILFSTSTAYHTSSLFYSKNRIHSFLHICDRVVIYLFIAGSYTPWFVLRTFYASLNWSALLLVWLLALLGIALQCKFHEQKKTMSLCIYLSVGLSPSLIILHCNLISTNSPSVHTYQHGMTCLMTLSMGGLVYVLGTVFFKLDGRIPMAHAIWHCFVAFGAYLHYCAISEALLNN